MPRPRAPKPELLSLYHLTAREREILEAVAQGLDNDGIARGLNISEKTVRNDVSTVMSKLGVTQPIPDHRSRPRSARFSAAAARAFISDTSAREPRPASRVRLFNVNLKIHDRPPGRTCRYNPATVRVQAVVNDCPDFRFGKLFDKACHVGVLNYGYVPTF